MGYSTAAVALYSGEKVGRLAAKWRYEVHLESKDCVEQEKSSRAHQEAIFKSMLVFRPDRGSSLWGEFVRLESRESRVEGRGSRVRSGLERRKKGFNVHGCFQLGAGWSCNQRGQVKRMHQKGHARGNPTAPQGFLLPLSYHDRKSR